MHFIICTNSAIGLRLTLMIKIYNEYIMIIHAHRTRIWYYYLIMYNSAVTSFKMFNYGLVYYNNNWIISCIKIIIGYRKFSSKVGTAVCSITRSSSLILGHLLSGYFVHNYVTDVVVMSTQLVSYALTTFTQKSFRIPGYIIIIII